MSRYFHSAILFSLASLFLSSCAYFQTNKKVREWGARYKGSEVTAENVQLYSSQGQWYVAAPYSSLKRHYPALYDTVFFRRNNEPVDYAIPGTAEGLLYMPISKGTAEVLKMKDGYAEPLSLVDESKSIGMPPATELKKPRKHEIKAFIDPKNGSTPYVLNRIPEKPETPLVVLSYIDKYTVDVLGTVVYNVSMPVMAPFRFFWEFLTED